MSIALQARFSITISAVVLASLTPMSIARAEFQGRYLTADTSRGFDAYYDTALNVTWLADALYGGRKEWDYAMNWAETVRLGGYDDWRLPTFSNGSGNSTTGEFYQMWVVELGNNHDGQHPVWTFNPGPFHNVEYYISSGAYNPQAAYWTDGSNGDVAYAWMTFNAFWIGQFKEGTSYGVWLCRTGDSGWAPPPPCAPDFNADGFLDFTDFDAFVAAFENGDAASDFNADGFLDFTDFDGFVSAFENGC